MPRRVDHQQRRRRIAEALWRIVSSRGLDDVGLREIAAEAGVSLGQLQHYFKTRDELLIYALAQIGELASERVQQRLGAIRGPKTPYAIIRTSLQEMLPLDPDSRTGLLVHVAFVARAVHDPQLRAITKGGTRPLADLFADQLGRARAERQIPTDRDPDTEAALLICLADGLTNYVLLDVLTPPRAQAMLDAHLANLFTGAAS